MQKVTDSTCYDPRNKRIKWKILVRQIREMHGIRLMPNPNPIAEVEPEGKNLVKEFL